MASLKEQLAAIEKRLLGSSDVKLASGKTMLQIVDEELIKLEKYIKDNINEYLNSYTPVLYDRTGAWLDSIYITKSKIDGNTITASILFNDTMAYHPSVMGEDQEFGYTPILMEVGWDISDKIGRDIPMFSKHKGVQYIKRAVEKFNSENKHGIKVNVYFDNEQYI